MNKILLGIVLILVVIIFGYNSPTPPPYYQYSVSGNIRCDSLPLENYTVGLFGKNILLHSEYQLINGNNLSNHPSIDLTDSAGFYQLIANSGIKLDSLKLGIVQPGKPTIFSEVYIPDEGRYVSIFEYYDREEPGCNSCSETVVSPEAIIDHYEYYLIETEIILCGQLFSEE